MRQRIEDLGRLAVLLRNLDDCALFEIPRPGRPKDTYEYLEKFTDEQKEELIEKFFYAISDLEDKIAEMICIAEGHDYLNDEQNIYK